MTQLNVTLYPSVVLTAGNSAFCARNWSLLWNSRLQTITVSYFIHGRVSLTDYTYNTDADMFLMFLLNFRWISSCSLKVHKGAVNSLSNSSKQIFSVAVRIPGCPPTSHYGSADICRTTAGGGMTRRRTEEDRKGGHNRTAQQKLLYLV